MAEEKTFQRPGRIEALFNRLVGKLVALGVGPEYMRVLDVRGRKSGRIISTPVNILELNGVLYLVAPRGNTHWARNARAAGRIRLRRGRSKVDYQVEEIPSQDRPDVLREYLQRYRAAVQRYFSVNADADQKAFEAVAESHPVFRLTTLSE
jgi:deazaflavin-dependent oxidoreductase (nitroreductase family)